MTNPYQTPAQHDFSADLSQQSALPGRGLIRHVRPIGIMMMIQGGLETLMTIVLVVVTIFMGIAFANLEREVPPGTGEEFPPLGATWILVAMYGVSAFAIGMSASLHIWAGIRIYQFRARTLGLVALVTGLVSVFGCYCFPTALGLAIYGMIVLLNGPVGDAFRMRADGHSVDAIFKTFDNRLFQGAE